MSRKVAFRVDEGLYKSVKAEQERFGYRSLSAYICKILKERTVVEVSGGDELAKAVYLLDKLSQGDTRLSERRELLCQSYDSLMTAIANLLSSIESFGMSAGMEK